MEYFLEKIVSRQTINAGLCASEGLGLSDEIDQAQRLIKVRNFGQVSNRIKRSKVHGIGIHRELFWKVTITGLHSVQSNTPLLAKVSRNGFADCSLWVQILPRLLGFVHTWNPKV
jgi:hypothetical protein